MLDNKNLLPRIIKQLQEMPISDRRDLPRDAKVDIYDRNCGKCGFCRIEVIDKNGIQIFHNVNDAIGSACINYQNKFEINRTCEYPGNIVESDYGFLYPTLTEIIMNTCRLWMSTKIEQCEEVAEEIIAEQIETSDRQLPEHGSNGKIFHNEVIPEGECKEEIFRDNTSSNIFGQEEKMSMLCDEIPL